MTYRNSSADYGNISAVYRNISMTCRNSSADYGNISMKECGGS
jgi:hypothetical protein